MVFVRLRNQWERTYKSKSLIIIHINQTRSLSCGKINARVRYINLVKLFIYIYPMAAAATAVAKSIRHARYHCGKKIDLFCIFNEFRRLTSAKAQYGRFIKIYKIIHKI